MDSTEGTGQSEPLNMKTSHNNDFQMFGVPNRLGNTPKDMAAGHARCC